MSAATSMSSLSRIRLVTFDVTNTLLRFRKPPGELYAEAASRHGLRVDPHETTRRFTAAYKRAMSTHPNFGRRSVGWGAWWRRVVGEALDEGAAAPPALVDAVFAHLVATYESDEAWERAEGCSEVLSSLRQCGVPVGAVSNFDPRLESVLRATGLRPDALAFAVGSYEADCAKPDPGIFARAMREAPRDDLSARECLHVGDSRGDDYEGARRAGWHGAVITGDSGTSDEGSLHFRSLVELNAFFARNKRMFAGE